MRKLLLSQSNKKYFAGLIRSVFFIIGNIQAQTTNTGNFSNTGTLTHVGLIFTNTAPNGNYNVASPGPVVFNHWNQTFINDGIWNAVTGFAGAQDNFAGNDGDVSNGNSGSAITIAGAAGNT